MIMICISAVFAIIFCGFFVLSYFKSKGMYDEYIDTLDKGEYALKDFFPIGLYINNDMNLMKLVPNKLTKYFHKYNLGVKSKISELHGVKYGDYYYMIHNANKTAMALLVAAGASLFAVIMALQGDGNSKLFVAVSLAGLIAMPFVVDKGLDDKIEKRRLKIQLEFPDFINKLTLLVNAGMTISKAWEKIVLDNTKKSVLYDEMSYALSEISAGKPEAVAYEEFGRRCKIKEIIKFVSVIILNLKKGGSDVVPVLKVQGDECWEMRKNAAKKLGEEASTKILIPLMIMFVGIIIIVCTPAILSISGM